MWLHIASVIPFEWFEELPIGFGQTRFRGIDGLSDLPRAHGRNRPAIGMWSVAGRLIGKSAVAQDLRRQRHCMIEIAKRLFGHAQRG